MLLVSAPARAGGGGDSPIESRLASWNNLNGNFNGLAYELVGDLFLYYNIFSLKNTQNLYRQWLYGLYRLPRWFGWYECSSEVGLGAPLVHF